MKRHLVMIALAGLLSACLAGTAAAWGPRVQLTIVNTALQLISRERNLPLTRLQNDVRAGAEISPMALEELFPDAQTDSLRAIENEMALLTAARGEVIDAYFAWRLGALGKLVSRVTAPMTTAASDLRMQYYNDAEQAVDAGTLKAEPRTAVDSMARLERIIREANVSNDMIESDYKTGRGFRASGASQMPADVSRSVNSVADVWWTIITSRAVPGNISEAQLQRYVLSAYAFYIDRGNTAEIEAAETNYRKLVNFTPDMSARIGDMFYNAGLREQAVKEYEAVLAAAPDRRDVVEKLGNYYFEKAEESLERGLLEDALAKFEQALATNLLHPTAEQRRLEVAALIRQRDEQMAEYQSLLKQADELRQLAEEEALRQRFAEAVALLKQAEELYKAVGDEFPMETQRRARGLRDTQARAAEWQQGLLNNTLAFSGAGFAPDMDVLISEHAKGLEQEALKALLRREYQIEVRRLESKMQSVLSIE